MHGNDVRFYKYMSPEAALASLDNGTMKWSSPRLFNDPFDFPTSIDFGFQGDDLANAFLDELVRMAYGPEEPKGDPKNPFIQATMMNRRLKKRPPEAEFRAFMEAGNAEMIERYDQGLAQRREFLSNFRNQFAVFCVSAKKDDLLMWAHYAKDHTGCVFQFQCLPELNRPLCAAEEVNYVEDYPVISDLDDYIKHITGQAEIDYDKLFKIFAFTKSQHWAYETEWRCVSQLQDKETGFDYEPFLPQEFEAIYLGHRATDETKEALLGVLGRKYPNTAIFSSNVNIQEYSMFFEDYS